MKRNSCNIGDKFGHWEVIDNTPIIKSGCTYVTVRCDCGKEGIRSLSDLIHGRTKGCKSCSARSRGTQVKIGEKHKNWTVINGPKLDNHGAIIYEIQCECGSTKWASPWEITNPNKCFKCQKCAQKERGEKDQIKNGKVGDLGANKFGKIRKGAEARNIEFSVTIPYLWNLYESQNRLCAITNDPIPDINEASLDRINSNIGYVEDNVQWATSQANLSKHTMTMDELYEFCRKVLNHANQQPSQPLTKLEGSETNG